MLDSIKSTFRRLIDLQHTAKYRYLYHEFSLKERLTGIIGPRGVGKTTLMLQYIKAHFKDLNKVFYFSADHLYFNSNTIFEFIESRYQQEGIMVFFIDEIHKYQNWDQELKNLYDAFPDVKIIFSGSSSLDLIKGSYDLSRRAKLYQLVGLSFREFLDFKYDILIEKISFEKLLENPTKFNDVLVNIPKLKGLFKTYLQEGYYPFFLEDDSSYYEKILRIVDKTIHEDIAGFYQLKTQNLPLFKRILNYLSTIEPGGFSYHNVAKNLSVDDKTVVHYLTILQETGLIRTVSADAKGNPVLRKPEKVFINNTTLTYAINSALGNPCSLDLIRELFFLQSLEHNGVNVHYSKVADYKVKDVLFEIGGKNKTATQVKELSLPNFMVKDDILIATKREIPLALFGLLY